MLKQLMLINKITQARELLETFTLESDGLLEKRGNLEQAIEDAGTEEEIKVVEENVTELEVEELELAEKKNKLEGEIAALETELEELKSKQPTNDEREKGDDNMDIREGLVNYVRTKSLQERAGFKIVDGGSLVPVEIFAPFKALQEEVKL